MTPLPFLPLLSYLMPAYTVSGHGVMGAWDEIILLAVVLSAFGLYAWFMRRSIKQRQKPPEAAHLTEISTMTSNNRHHPMVML